MSVSRLSDEAGFPARQQNQNELSENVFDISELFQEPPVETTVRRGAYRIGGATLNFTVVQPTNPDDLKSKTAFISAHGICGIEDAYADQRNELAGRGYRAVTYSPPRSVGVRRGLHPSHALHPEKLLGQALYGTMLGAKEQFGFEKYTVLAHSLGGLTVKSLVDHHGKETVEDLIEAIILQDTVGLHPHSWKRTGVDFVKMGTGQIGRYVKKRAREDSPQRLVHAAAAGAHYLFREPTRVWREGIKAKNTTHTEMGESLQRVRDLDIPIGYIGMQRSVVFSDKMALRHSSHLFDAHYSGDWDHLGPMADPKGTNNVILDMTNLFVARPRRQMSPIANAG